MITRLQAALFTAVYACGIVWALWLAQIHISGRFSLSDRLETYLLDLRILVNGAQAPPADVVIVAIDDETIDDLGRFPVGRGDVAVIVEKIAAAGAGALAVDILLAGATQEPEDNRLADALKKLPSLIASAGQFNDQDADTSPFPAPDRELTPLPLFLDAAQTGLVNVSTDGGGTPRYLPMAFQTSAGLSPSFALRAVGLFLDRQPSFTFEAVRVGGNLVPLDLKWHLPLRYYGPAKSIPTLSAARLLSGTQPSVSLDGRLVVLAVTATAVGDRFNTPFDPILPGAEVLATGISNLLQGSGLVRDSSIRRTDGAVTLVFTVFGMLAIGLLPLATATVLYIIALAGWLVFIAAAYANGYWFNGILPFAGSVAPVIVVAVMRQGFDWARFRRMARARDALSRFHAPGLAARISDDPDFLKVPRQQNAAILFIDLAGYTGLSEKYGPAQAREVLKNFHTVVVDETMKHDGVVLDLMGDGAMIGFGILEESRTDAARACRCAFALVREIGAWLSSTGPGSDIKSVRVGGHFGPVVISRLGHENHQQVAATGDSVNAASRLQDAARQFEACVVLSRDLTGAASEGDFSPNIPSTRTISLRGRQQPIEIGLWMASEVGTVFSTSRSDMAADLLASQ